MLTLPGLEVPMDVPQLLIDQYFSIIVEQTGFESQLAGKGGEIGLISVGRGRFKNVSSVAAVTGVGGCVEV